MKLISVDKLLEEAKGTGVYFLIKAIVTKLPKIDAAPLVHGHWIRTNKGEYNFECSCCGYGLTDNRLTYCYDCGAKMNKETDNE